MPRTDIASPHGATVVLVEPAGTRTFDAGRRALQLAFGETVEIPTDDRGAPVLPRGHGSIAHKTGPDRVIAAAIAAPFLVGIDVERAAAPSQPIERRILTPRERAMIGADRRHVTLVFAIKEAIYKAVDPIVRRYVGFTEVEVDLDAGRITSQLPLELAFWWRELTDPEPLWLATARALR